MAASIGLAAALSGLGGLSARGDEFYSRGTQSYEARHLLAHARGGLPDLIVVFPVGHGAGKPVLDAVQAVATLIPRVFYSRPRGYAVVAGKIDGGRPAGPTAKRLAAQLSHRPGVLVGGSALVRQEFVETTARDLLRGEALVVPLLLLLAFIAFRSLVAAALPVLAGCLSVAFGLAALRLTNAVYPVSVLAIDLLGGLAMGLSLDYSLLMVARFREELSRGATPERASSTTLRTAGRTVAISAGIVIVSFSSALVFPIEFLRSLVIGGALAAASAAAVALIATPAALAFLGDRVNSLAPRKWQRSSRSADSLPSQGFWYRLAKLIARRPLVIAVASSVLLLALGIPALRMRTTGLNGIALPSSSAPVRLEHRLRTAFEAPLLEDVVVVTHGDERRIADLMEHTLSHISDVEAGEANQFSRGLWAIELQTAGSPFGRAARGVVERIRALPSRPLVTGASANYLDTDTSLKRYLPLAVALLVLSNLAILFAATGSLILPLKTLLLSGLSLAATMGVLVLIFQPHRGHPFAIIQPIVVAVGAFGLLTDYGVFLLTRIAEGWRSGLSNSEAVAVGLQRTGATITTAALLFCAAVAGLLDARLAFVRETAVGLMAAVAIDAVLVRALLVPSVMTILGDWNWWPRRRSRQFPRARAPGLHDVSDFR